MKRIYFILVGALISTMLFSQCADPLKGFELNVSTDVIHYTTLIQVKDANGGSVGNDITVTITGRDAASIYNLAGEKQFALSSGILGLGVTPYADPTAGNNIQFTVVLSGAGYVTQNVPVTINYNQFESVKTVTLLKPANPPVDGIVESITTTALVNNATASPIVLTTGSGDIGKQSVNIEIASGTQFLDAAGTVITGASLRSSVTLFDPSEETALAVFPGGSLTTNNVIPEGGGAAETGSFVPAGLVNIEFSIGNTQVKQFSKPITIDIGLEPTFINPSTGASLQAGDELGIYSYDNATAQWTFEKNVTVTMVNGNPVARFETNHLTWYMIGSFFKSCNTPLVINVLSPWMQDGITYSLTVEAIIAGKVVSSTQASVTKENPTITLPQLPVSSGLISIRVRDNSGRDLTENEGFYGIKLVALGCTALPFNFQLNEPTSNPKVTLQLYVRCPGDDLVLNVLPTFYLYVRDRENGETEFKLLGVVKNGFISTSMLTAGAKYDFKAVWGDKVKVVVGKTVTADNSGTVGIEPGDIIGEKAGAVNLEMLTEACNTIK
ncbi:hypothetical protein [Albibacterium bauzanense]|uniref:Uncharacterized protein n=1 Tax=Albibacterium bauzanense TaxID=653929 RepID=A0A4R1LZB9_9SPHI|nr:hypothetical protein [Albibacterium bauzanense]TCK84936.1 hypothetical protein C8N28_0232 [Albibacterium bauzanense]